MNEQKSSQNVHIYGPSFSNFVRSVMLICEERNIGYTTGFELNGNKIAFQGDEHLALHPYGKLPLLFHGDFVLGETSSICRYLEKHFPQDNDAKLTIQQQAKSDEFCAITSIYLDKAIVRDYLLEFVFPKGEGGEIRLDVAKNAQQEVHKALAVIENELANADLLNKKYLSITDALVAPMLHYLSTLPTGFNLLFEYPACTEYLNTLMKRESCKKVLTVKG
ncbi:glutathione S-transferase family protein [Colwelliaceae bacterium 6471]